MASRPSQSEDLLCVAAALDGRPEAFGEIVKRYQDRIFNTIFRMLGDYEEATDLTQQTFLKAYMSLDRFGGRSSFYTWLYRIGVNATLDERKKRSRRPRITDHVVAVTAGRDARRMSDGTRSRAMTATAPASSAIFACPASTTSMMTPPSSISAKPRLTSCVPVS